MSRCLWPMKAQQAPAEAWHSCAVAAWKSALTNSHSTAAGTVINNSQATSTVSTAFRGVAARPRTSRPSRVPRSGGADSVCPAMSALHQRNAPVVPVHQYGDGQTDGEIGGHDDK